MVISVGHYMQRKGILDFIALARKMPQVQFLWFGYTDPHLVPHNVKAAMADALKTFGFRAFSPRQSCARSTAGRTPFCFAAMRRQRAS